MMEILKQEIDDLRSFSDPFEDFKYDIRDQQNKEEWTARLVRKGKDIRVVRKQDGVITIYSRGGSPRQYKDFRALLVSDMFADLERLATAQRHQVAESICDSTNGKPKSFIDNRIVATTDEDLGLYSFEDVSTFLNERDWKSNLRVVVIDGMAGVGKTLLIKRIVYQRSNPESYKSGNPLLIHVESLGKVLTALDDRIEGTLSNLRASFVKDELKPLIRRGLIQLAIDGFDELSDSRGYSRSWGALRDFLRDLKDQGTCILAGRDTMLNEKTVAEGLGWTIGDSRVIFLSFHEPQPEDIKNWLAGTSNWRGEEEALEQIENQARNIEYIRRPFFVSLIADAIDPGEFRDSGGEPIVDLMNKMILRESRKLIPYGEHVDLNLISSLYASILSEVAQMMMDDETDSIDIGLLELIVEDVLTGKLDKETVDAIRYRAGTLAMLEQSSGEEDRRVFPHEVIKSYFFAKSVIDYLPKYGPMNALYRNLLNMEDLRIFNRVVRNETSPRQYDLRNRFIEILRNESDVYVTSNLGGLLLSFLPLEGDEIEGRPFILTHSRLQNAWMGEHIDTQQAQLYDCEIGKLDVRGADLSGIEFHNVRIQELFVDRFVKFGDTTPDHVATLTQDLRHHHTGVTKYTKTLFDPAEIKEWISSCRNPVEYEDLPMNEEYRLLEKFARISMRQYWLRSIDDEAKKLVGSEHWDPLCELLKRYDRLKVKDNVPAAGPPSRWFHLVGGRDFLSVVGGNDTSSTPSTQDILKELGLHI